MERRAQCPAGRRPACRAAAAPASESVMTAIAGPKVTLKRAGGTDRPRLYEWLIGSDLTANMMGGQMFPDHPITPPERFAAQYPDWFYDGSRPYAGRMFLISARGEDVGCISYG